MNRYYRLRIRLPRYAKERDEKVAALAAKHKVEVETFLRHTFLDVDALVASPGFKPPTNNGRVESMVRALLLDRTCTPLAARDTFQNV